VDKVGIGEAITHSQDRANTLQENIPAFDRDHASRVRDDSQLAVSQTNHAARRSGDVNTREAAILDLYLVVDIFAKRAGKYDL
jgi:hypothetical protein